MNKTRALRWAASLVILLSTASVASAQQFRRRGATTAPAGEAAPAVPVLDRTDDGKLTPVKHTITIDGKPFDYRTTAGTLPMKDDAGKTHANIFFVAYDIDAKDLNTRPITFCYNGGPGAAAIFLQIGGIGPRTLVLDDKGFPVGPTYKLADNPATWLKGSDLVFIDPVSTGYSRPASGESADQFHGYRNDISSIGQFIHTYMTKYRRWGSPVYLAGESYGTTRSAGLVGYLDERYGIAVSGVTLVSSVLDFSTLQGGPANDLVYEMYLPSYAAVAWYHKKIAPEYQGDLQKTIDAARKFTTDEYAPAMLKGSSLTAEERAALVKKIAGFTGLTEDFVERNNLRISPGQFEKQALGNGHDILGRYDARVVGYDPDAGRGGPAYDPSLARYQSAYASAFMQYVHDDLGYDSDLTYETLADVQPWPMTSSDRGMRGGGDGGGQLYVIDELEATVLQHPQLRVQFLSGYYDLATPFFSADYTIDRMKLSPDARARVTHLYFPSGHMIYHNREAAAEMGQEMEKFLKP
jgi:carboxypeptidase C (cathepsin A)